MPAFDSRLSTVVRGYLNNCGWQRYYDMSSDDRITMNLTKGVETLFRIKNHITDTEPMTTHGL